MGITAVSYSPSTNNLVEPEEGTLRTMRSTPLILSQTDESLVRGEVLRQRIWLSTSATVGSGPPLKLMVRRGFFELSG